MKTRKKDMSGRLRVLSITTMFPNERMPVHAQFVKQRLDALAALVDLTVVSPIPWFPGETWFARYANRHWVPYRGKGTAYPAFYPKFFSPPAVLKPLDGFTLALCVLFFAIRRGLWGKIDILDCHLAFPEGFAGALLKPLLRAPCVVTLRGHDINDLYRFPVRIRQVVFALRRCDRYFGVAQALVDGAVKLGAPAGKGFRSANGVDCARFRPSERGEARRFLGLPEGRWMLSVCHLNKRKGVDILVRALALLRAGGHADLRYAVVGKGGEEGDVEPQLRSLAAELGVADRIHWAGAVDNTELHRWYSAADVFCLASEKEGWPNVILESLACGTPVVATRTWGVPEVLCSEDYGLLVDPRTPGKFAEAVAAALDKDWSREAMLAYARANTWGKVAEGLHRHLLEVSAGGPDKMG